MIHYYFKWKTLLIMLHLDTFNFLLYDVFERHMRPLIIFWLKGTSRTFTFFSQEVFWTSKVLVTLLCSTLCNSMDCCLAGSSAHGILQARILEWVAISSSRDLPDRGTSKDITIIINLIVSQLCDVLWAKEYSLGLESYSISL